jgi:hypothetical protein
MIFLLAKFFCQPNGLFHPKDLFAAFHDPAFQGIAQFTLGIPDSSAGDAPSEDLQGSGTLAAVVFLGLFPTPQAVRRSIL